jgi:hypothetical protein
VLASTTNVKTHVLELVVLVHNVNALIISQCATVLKNILEIHLLAAIHSNPQYLLLDQQTHVIQALVVPTVDVWCHHKVMQLVHAYQVIEELFQLANQNVLLVRNANKPKLVSIRSV